MLVGHVAAVRCVQYDGRLVVSGAYDYMVKVGRIELLILAILISIKFIISIPNRLRLTILSKRFGILREKSASTPFPVTPTGSTVCK